MSIYGVSFKPKSNQLPSGNFEGLPLPIFKGNLSISLNFEGQPSATLSVESISEQEIELYRNIYGRIGRKLTLFENLYFEVGSYAETEDMLSIENFQIRSYNVSVNLRGGNEVAASNPIETRTNRRGRDGFVSNLVVSNVINIAQVANRVGIAYSGYSTTKSVPANSGRFSLTFASLIEEKLRLNQQMLDWHDRVVRTKNYREGKNWNITTQDINYSVEVSKQVPSEYIDTIMSGTGGLPFLTGKQLREATLGEAFGDEPERKEPVKRVIPESDPNPEFPPPDVRKLRTLDMNFDMSGPRKTRKVTTTLNGQPFQEEVFNYGLAYLAQDIRNLEAEDETVDVSIPALKSNNPADYWQLIEYQKTEYIYKPADVKATVTAIDQNNQRFTGQIQGSNLFTTKYLTEVKTTGWKLARFQQEQFDDLGTDQNSLDSRWLNDEIEALAARNDLSPDEALDLQYARDQLKSISFQRIPFRSSTQYVLEPTTNIYEDAEQTPFKTQLIANSELGRTGGGQSLIAVPDPNYIFPMKVLQERVLTQSFAQMDHPQNIFIRADRQAVIDDPNLTSLEKSEDLKDLKLLPWLITGEDTYRAVTRKVVPSKNTKGKFGTNRNGEDDLYLEYEANSSNSDYLFQYTLQEKTFKTILGQLPDATTFSEQFDEESDEVDENDPSNFEYRINSTSDFSSPRLTDSVQYETSSLQTALATAKCELELDQFLSSSDVNINLAWYYPQIRPGDYVKIIDDGSKKNLRVKSVSFDINYQGMVEGEVLKTCDGTSLTCGIMPTKTINFRRVRKDSNEELEIKTKIRGKPSFGSSIVPNIRTRRNPSAEQVEDETGVFL